MDIVALIETVGYVGLFVIVFAESSFVFFLPGDSLLFTAGFLASQNIMSLPILIITCFIAAILGNNIGYGFGRKMGERFFKNNNSILFSPKNITKASLFYAKHGSKTVVLGRFLPVVRTFVPIVAGLGKMNYRIFVIFNIVGAILWAIGLTIAGYFLGKVIPNVDKYLLPIVIGIIVLSLAPSVIHILKDPDSRQDLKKLFCKIFRIRSIKK